MLGYVKTFAENVDQFTTGSIILVHVRQRLVMLGPVRQG